MYRSNNTIIWGKLISTMHLIQLFNTSNERQYFVLILKHNHDEFCVYNRLNRG